MKYEKQNTKELMIAVKCECGKTLAYRAENGEIIIKCRTCKRCNSIKPNK